jgi:Uncharacterised protein family (UPF0236)
MHESHENRALPDEILARAETLGRELVAFAREHRDGPLAELERGVLAIVRQALPDLLGEVIRRSRSTLAPRLARLPQSCPCCGERAAVQSWRRREVLTVCGKISFERPWHVCRACAKGFSPTDASLELLSRARLSPELQAYLVELGAKTSFAEGAALLARLTGLVVSPETVRSHTERLGSALEAAQEAAAAEVQSTREAAAPLDPAPGMLVIETDGVMVRYLDGFHEVKLGLVGGQVEGTLVAPSYLALRASPDAFGQRLLAEAARRGALEVVGWEGPVTGRGLAKLRPVVVLGDGAVWIWNLAAEHFGERIEIIDYYHASEHVWTLANAFYGEGSDKAKDWARRQCGRLLTRGVAGLLRALSAIKACRPEAQETLRRERGYFKANACRMAYPRFRAQGLPIGSGAIESEAKRLVQQRMKLPGARWSEPGAQAVLNVRSQLLSRLPLAC